MTLAALLSVPPVFFTGGRGGKGEWDEAADAHAAFASPDGDHCAMLNVWRAWRAAGGSPEWANSMWLAPRALTQAGAVRQQLAAVAERLGLSTSTAAHVDPTSTEPIRRCLVQAFFTQCAVRVPGGGGDLPFRTRDGLAAALHPSSFLSRRRVGAPGGGAAPAAGVWVVYHEMVLTTKTFLRTASFVEPTWLVAAAPKHFDAKMPDGEMKRAIQRLPPPLKR